MKSIILITILALTTATSGVTIQQQIRNLLFEASNEGLATVQNAPLPFPPDYGNTEISLPSTINFLDEPWDNMYDDTGSDEYRNLKIRVEIEVEEGMENLTVTDVNATDIRSNASAAVTVAAIYVVADMDITFRGILGDNESLSEFCAEYHQILVSLNGEEDGVDCFDELVRERQSVCNDTCPSPNVCIVNNGVPECQHPCYIRQKNDPSFCSGSGQVCIINSTDPNNIELLCECDDKYLNTGDGCTSQNTIIIPSAVVGGVLFLALVITVAVLASRISAKEKKEKDAAYFSSSGDMMDETEFENRAFTADDTDSGIAGPVKGGTHDEEPVYRDFDDMDAVNDTSKQNGSINRMKPEVNGVPGGRPQPNDMKTYTDMKRDQPSIREYAALNGREVRGKEDRDYEPYDHRGQDRGQDEKPTGRDEKPTGRTGYDDRPQQQYNRTPYDDPLDRTNNRYQDEKREPLYSSLNKNSVSSNRNRVLREPDMPDRHYNRPAPMYNEPQGTGGDRSNQNERSPYGRGPYGTADRGYDRPAPRAPGVPERRYSRNDQDYGLNPDYNQGKDDNYIPESGSIRIGSRDASRELNRDSYQQNWNFEPSGNRRY